MASFDYLTFSLSELGTAQSQLVFIIFVFDHPSAIFKPRVREGFKKKKHDNLVFLAEVRGGGVKGGSRGKNES